MEMVSEYIVLLWMLPVTVFLFVPAIIFCAASLVSATRYAVVNGCELYKRKAQHSAEMGKKDRRQELRIARQQVLRADVACSMTTCTGLVTNISSMGICLKDVPERFSITRAFLTITIHNHSENYRLVASPRWGERFQSSTSKTIGLEIARAPENWRNLFALA